MIERNIKETIREYDEQGNLVRETVTETVEKTAIRLPPMCHSSTIMGTRRIAPQFRQHRRAATSATVRREQSESNRRI